jgi:predicted ATPase
VALECGLGPPDGDEGEITYSYGVELGFPPPIGVSREAFPAEPQVKEERFHLHHGRRPVALLERRGPAVFARDAEGRRSEVATDLLASETAFGALDDPQRFPELHEVRRAMLQWRFYHDLRTDPASPLRRPSLAVASPALASDGGDLAAVFATLVHLRQDTGALDRAVDDAFRGPSSACHCRDAPPPSGWSSRTTRGGSSPRPNCPTARCAIWRSPARCCPCACRPSLP